MTSTNLPATHSPARASSDRVSVRLLGPVEVWVDGAAADLRGERQRALVAVLVQRPGVVVPVDRLTDLLWDGDELPNDPRGTLHTYASRVRQALGGGVVRSRDGGYVLEIGPGAVDVHRFEALVRAAADPTRPLTWRIGRLEEALSLWRGTPYEGLRPAHWWQADAVRLVELRATAIEDRAEWSIEIGRAVDVVADLEAAAAAAPVRERTQALLMSALNASGRQAEALRVFQAYRRRLATDLGLEPGDGIVALDRAIASGAHVAVNRAPHGRARGYVLGEPIGQGAFAVVHRARQPGVERDVAIKIIRPELANRAEFIRRFEAEAHLVAHLEHPHIVPLYDYWREPGSACLVMRLFPAGTLEDLIAGRPLAIADVTTMVTQIGAALDVAHRAGVVHRDVKPANVFLDGDGNYYLGDFGIAFEAAAPPLAADSLSVGSPAYASPEQLRREPVGPQADIHGLAIAVFECLTGHLPFREARTEAELLRLQLSEPLPSVRSARPELDPAVDRVLATATAKDPLGRHATVGDFAAELLDALSGASALPQPRRVGAATVVGGLRNPYKGLLAFQEADAADFFGRQRLIDRLIDQCSRSGVDGRFVLVTGASGAGKSSLVRAGLLPALRAGAVAGSGGWFVTSMMPGAHPFEELEAALARVAAVPAQGLAEMMSADHRGIARAVKQVLPDEHGELLVVIDQFEELFTLCPDEPTRQAFIAGLVDAVSDPRSRLRVVATMRADFYASPLRYPGLAPLAESGSVAVTPLAADELDRAITEPALRTGVIFEPGLVARIVADVVDQPGALPLLQYALTELYERRASGMLTIGVYEQLGGLSGALARRGEELYEAATPDERDAIRRVFSRLVTLGEGTEDTRRRVLMSELAGPDAACVVERYAAARLLATDRDPVTREPTVEVAHEALLREWPRLRGWLDENRDGLRLHRHLTIAAAAWAIRGRDRGELYRGGRLESAAAWAANNDGEMNEVEREFVTTAIAQQADEAAAEERSARRIRRSLVGVAIVAIVALVAGAVAWQQQRTASRNRVAAERAAVDADVQRADAEAQRAIANAAAEDAQRAAYDAETGRLAALAPNLVETDLQLALLLAAESNRRADTPETKGALLNVLAGAGQLLGYFDITGAAIATGFAEDGSIVIMTAETLSVFDPDTGALEWSVALPETPAEWGYQPGELIDVGPQRVAWVGADRDVWIADLTTRTIEGFGYDDASGVALVGPTGLAVADAVGDVTLYETIGGVSRWSVPGDGLKTLGDVAEAVDTGVLDGANSSLADDPIPTVITVSTDGSTIFTTRGVSIRALRRDDGTLLAEVPVPDPPTQRGLGATGLGMRTVPDRPTEVLLNSVISIFLVDTATTDVVDLSLPYYQATTTGVVPLSSDEFVIQGLEGELWRYGRDRTPLGPAVDPRIGRVGSSSFDRASAHLIVGGNGRAALLSLGGDGILRSSIDRPPGGQWYPVTSPSGNWLVMTEDARQGRPQPLYDCTGGECPSTPVRMISANETTYAGLLDDGDMVVTDDVAQTWSIVDSASGELVLGPFDSGGFPGQPVLAADRSWIALHLGRVTPEWILTHDLVVLSLPDGRRMAEFRLSQGDFPMLAFNEASTRLVVYDPIAGNAPAAFDTSTWQQIPPPLSDDGIVMAEFSPDGTLLLTVDRRGVSTLRDGTTFEALRTLRSDTGSGNVWGKSAAFSPDNRYLITAIDGRARLWDVMSGAAIGGPVAGLVIPKGVAWLSSGDELRYYRVTEDHVETWHFDIDRFRDMACEAAGRNLTEDEWAIYVSRDQPYEPTCPQWPPRPTSSGDA
jgi:DNA-binding SARP family transcriptional activator/tRNA A-37 threonylcarbamoyl transferase component Bud32